MGTKSSKTARAGGRPGAAGRPRARGGGSRMPCCASQTRHQLHATALKRTLGWAKIADSPADPRSSAHGQPGCIGHRSIGGLLRLPAWRTHRRGRSRPLDRRAARHRHARPPRAPAATTIFGRDPGNLNPRDCLPWRAIWTLDMSGLPSTEGTFTFSTRRCGRPY